MLPTKTGESFVGIIVGVFILSIVILGIANLMIYSANLITIYLDNARVSVLKESLGNIVTEIDTSAIRENEIFYIYKDESIKEYKVFTGATNAGYKYIDKLGNHVADIVTYQDDIYGRILWTEREDTTLNEQDQIVRASIRKLIKTNP